MLSSPILSKEKDHFILNKVDENDLVNVEWRYYVNTSRLCDNKHIPLK